MGPIRSFDDLIDMVHRRAHFLVRLIAAGCVFSVLVALSQQHTYQSSEVIQIVRPKAANEQVRSNLAELSARRLQLIEQRLMTHDNMLEIIDGFYLYVEFPDLTPSELVHRLRQAVQIQEVATARKGDNDDSTMSVISITAEMPTPMQAQQVAHEIARRALSVNISLEGEQARETLAFYADLEEMLIARIATLGTRIAEFRNLHDLTLPGSMNDRRTEIASLNEALLENAQETILIYREANRVGRAEQPATVKRRQIEFNELLATLAEQDELLLDRKTELEQSIGTLPDIERELGDLNRQLQLLQGELEVVSAHKRVAQVVIRRDSERQDERLTVIESAPLPDYPITGSRKGLALIGGGDECSNFICIGICARIAKSSAPNGCADGASSGFCPDCIHPLPGPNPA